MNKATTQIKYHFIVELLRKIPTDKTALANACFPWCEHQDDWRTKENIGDCIDWLGELLEGGNGEEEIDALFTWIKLNFDEGFMRKFDNKSDSIDYSELLSKRRGEFIVVYEIFYAIFYPFLYIWSLIHAQLSKIGYAFYQTRLYPEKSQTQRQQKYKHRDVLKNAIQYAQSNKIDNDTPYDYEFVWFNAWLYSGSDNIWAGLIQRLYDVVEEHYGTSYHFARQRAHL
jgi:hypothetical protein